MLPDAYIRFRNEIAAILDTRKHSVEWLDVQIANGAIRTLSTDDAIILFRFERYPTGWLELQGMAAAGSLESIKDELIPQAEQLARSMKCGSAQIASREGWGRILKARGYEEYQRTIEKVF